ncbi:MAG: glycosyltransferase family 4 protein [Chitinophagaceae bacterium]
MKIISTSYIRTGEFDRPRDWLKRIDFYTGILDELARQHEVISIERINHEGVYLQNNVQYRFIHLKRKIAIFPWRMHLFIKGQHPDVVLVHGFIFPFQVMQLRWMLGKKVKIIVQNHAEKPSPGIRSFIQRVADRYIDAYLFTSAEMGKEWVEKGIISSTQKIAEVMEVSSAFKAIDRKEKEKTFATPVFLWVGRLNANKDPLTVIKAFINFLSFQPSAKLFLIYHTEELLQAVKDLINSDDKAKEAILLVGQMRNQDLEVWYNDADFFISGSHYESGGVAVCEAMACGCIPIVTDIDSFRYMTGTGKCGFLYEPGNDKALLEILLQTPKMDMQKERDKVLKQFKDELSFEAIAGKINKVINSL